MARSKTQHRSNAGGKLPKGKKKMPQGEPFKKGYDPRRNLKGRPKSFDQFRALALDIGEQIATMKDGTSLKWNGQEVTWAEFVLLSWLTDKKYMEKFAEAAYGKVPQVIEGTGPEGTLPVTIYMPKNSRDNQKEPDGNG